MSGNQFKIENYAAKAIIFAEGKRTANNFYIIRSGRVQTSRINRVIAEEPYSVLGPGDFFGVISCMSGHARIETATAIENVSLISVEQGMFTTLIKNNPDVAMKIIRFFSRKLRFFDTAITSISLQNNSVETPEHLFNVGSYYLKKNHIKSGVYALQRYLQYCPQGPNVDKAIDWLQVVKAPLKVPENADSMSMNRVYHDGDMIFSECEPGNELFIIQSGNVKITKIVNEEILLALLKPGDIFGEMAILDNKPRSASAISFGEVKMLAVRKQNFEPMVQQQPQVATRLIQLLSERIWTAYRQMENLMITNDIGRLYDMLLIQVDKQKIPVAKAPHFFEIGTRELANMVGLPPEKAEDAISLFIADKNIKIEGGKIICMDLSELEKTVSFYKKQSALERKREESHSKNA